MPLAYFPINRYLRLVGAERILDKIKFRVHKFNHRTPPEDLSRIKIIFCFSEFGCEVLGCLYCIPRLCRRFPGNYFVAAGWHGRAYLYRHLVDEFWEMDEEYMWLRDFTRAFHHYSKNLRAAERAAACAGQVIPSASLGKYAVCNFCRICGYTWTEWKRKVEKCLRCGNTDIVPSIFSCPSRFIKEARRIPEPSQKCMEWAKKYVPYHAVGVFARNRKAYGRNLSKDFYVRLIRMLRNMGYQVVWMGEKASVLPCPVDDVLDFSSHPFANNLEYTLAVIKHLDFTVQYWTASTRLAGIMGVPFLLFESPEQIYSSESGLVPAQEGKRIELTTFGKRKIVLSHFKNSMNNHSKTLQLTRKAIREMENDNWDDIIGMVENKDFILQIIKEYKEMSGSCE